MKCDSGPSRPLPRHLQAVDVEKSQVMGVKKILEHLKYPRPSQQNVWPMRLALPIPPHWWDFLNMSTTRLNGAVVSFDIHQNGNNKGYGKDCWVSPTEFIQDALLIACLDIGQNSKLRLELDEDLPGFTLYLNRQAWRDILDWVAVKGEARGTRGKAFAQYALQASELSEFVRDPDDHEEIIKLQKTPPITAWLVRFLPEHRYFVDLSCGLDFLGWSGFCKHFIIFDKVGRVANALLELRSSFGELVEAVTETPYPRSSWCRWRERDIPSRPVEWARRLITHSWRGLQETDVEERLLEWFHRVQPLQVETEISKILSTHDREDTLFWVNSVLIPEYQVLVRLGLLEGTKATVALYSYSKDYYPPAGWEVVQSFSKEVANNKDYGQGGLLYLLRWVGIEEEDEDL